MKVIIICEFSGVVRDAFRELGHEAFSCDIIPSPNNSPYHIQGDCFNSGINYTDFDLAICHPPCTYLTVTGNRWFKDNPKRHTSRDEAADFFMKLANLDVSKIAIENPVGVMSTRWRKPDQIIQPWQFGNEAQKTTCLWLKNLPKLVPTDIVGKGEMVQFASGKRMPKWYADLRSLPALARASARSVTFPGIARAMAKQWG
jgi:hypothetical protein